MNSLLKNGDLLWRHSKFFLIQGYVEVTVPLFQHAANTERDFPVCCPLALIRELQFPQKNSGGSPSLWSLKTGMGTDARDSADGLVTS